MLLSKNYRNHIYENYIHEGGQDDNVGDVYQEKVRRYTELCDYLERSGFSVQLIAFVSVHLDM